MDPVGACVGLRGQRVKNIVRELNNEKVDIIPWSADIKTFVAKALDPPTPPSITVDEVRKRIQVKTTQDQLPLAVGRRRSKCPACLPPDRVADRHEAEADANSFEARVDPRGARLMAVPEFRDSGQVLVNMGFPRSRTFGSGCGSYFRGAGNR